MTYASDRLYNEVIRRNLGNYATMLKVKEIMLHLPCLTLTDREEIEAKKDSTGNYAAVQMLLDNMRRRENWPKEFIAALECCEHRKLAQELSDAYDRIMGRTNNAAAATAPAQGPVSDSTAAATTTVTIHTVPLTTPPHLTQPSAKAPAQTTATSQIATQVSPPASELQHVEQVPAPATSPEPASQIPPPVVLSPQTSFPTVVSASNVTSTVQQNEVPPQFWATENKTPISDTPDVQTTTSLTDGNVLSNLSVQASSLSTSLSQTTNFYSPSQSSHNSEKDRVPLAVEETSQRLPVQDTNSPVNMEPKECSDPTVNETVGRTNTAGMPIKAPKTTATRIIQATPSAPAEVDANCFPSVSQDYFSKPGILQVPNEAFVMQEEPCSTTTTNLEISRSVFSAEPAQSVNLEHAINPLSFVSQSSDASTLNQPEEDHYESSWESQMGTRQHELRWSEEPSDENLNSQPPRMLSNTFNPCGGSGNMQHTTGIYEDQPAQSSEKSESVVYRRKPSGCDVIRPSDKERKTTFNYQEQESNATNLASCPKVDPREDGQTTSPINKLHVTAAAAAVGIGLFVVWKIKH